MNPRWVVVSLLSLLIVPVNAGSVTIAPRNPGPVAAANTNPGVQFKTQYGYLNATNTQYYDNFNVYANGTIMLNVTRFELSEPDRSLYFMEVNYGNGTMAVRVLTNIAPAIYGFTQKRLPWSGGTAGIELDFNGSPNSNGNAAPLTLVWGAIRTQILNAGFFVGTLFGVLLIFASVYWIMSRRDLSTHGFSHGVQELQRDKDNNMLIIAIGVLALILVASLVAVLYVGV